MRHVHGQLSPSWRGLLITLDYLQEEMAGPPFSIADSEAQALFQGVAPAAIIDRRDILDKEPKFQAAGVSRLDTVVYRLASNAPIPAASAPCPPPRGQRVFRASVLFPAALA